MWAHDNLVRHAKHRRVLSPHSELGSTARRGIQDLAVLALRLSALAALVPGKHGPLSEPAARSAGADHARSPTLSIRCGSL